MPAANRVETSRSCYTKDKIIFTDGKRKMDMSEFESKVGAFIDKHKLLEKGDYVLAAVSGGPDSLALLHYLLAKRDVYGISVAAGHVDHMLRGGESLEDLRFVERFCHKAGIPFEAVSIDIKEKMRLEGTGMQETARKHRYHFLKQAMAKLGANKLAFGHHGDDQIETILMRLVRSGSGKSRAGIPVSRLFGSGEIIRPFLGVTKLEIEEYCQENGLKPRLDPSNDTPSYTRNRIRLEVLPALRRENSQVHEHFQRFSEETAEDDLFLEECARSEMNKLLDKGEEELMMEIRPFLAMPSPLQRRGIHLILNYLYKHNTSALTATHTDMIQRLLRSGHPSGTLDLPSGLRVSRSYDICRFSFREPPQPGSFQYELDVDDQILLPNGTVIQLQKGTADLQQMQEDALLLDPENTQLPIIVRTREAGDRIQAKGLNGTKKVKDIFIDMKVPLPDRETWPIITDQTGKLLWIPGLKKSCYDIPPAFGHTYYILRYRNKQLLGGN